MKFLLSSLRSIFAAGFDVNDVSDDKIINRLTEIGLEVEGVYDRSEELVYFVIAEVLECKKHPSSDKLNVCTVNDATSVKQIVCGASNVRAGLKVVVAPIGSIIPSSKIEIKKASIRDVESNGMICSAEELCLEDDDRFNKNGIIELSDDCVIGQSFCKTFGFDQKTIEINLTPNRGDCASVFGIARDLAASGIFAEKKFLLKYPQTSFNFAKVPYFTNSALNNKTDQNFEIDFRVNSKSCENVCFIKISGLKNCVTPEYISSFLKGCGVGSKNLLVDVTNYVLMLYGKPLHVFDFNKLKFDQNGKSKVITIENLSQDESFTPIVLKSDSAECVLKSGSLVIKDHAGVISLAGIMGSAGSAVDINTCDIIIESAYFTPSHIMECSRKNGIKSDSSYRFERGVDRLFVEQGAKIAAEIITKHCGGVIEWVYSYTDAQNVDMQRKIDVCLDTVSQFLGFDVSQNVATEVLSSLGFEVSNANQNLIVVTVPSYRGDVYIWQDVAEEIARIIGYSNILPKPLPQPEVNGFNLGSFHVLEYKTLLKAKKLINAAGAKEVINYSFFKDGYHGLFSGFLNDGKNSDGKNNDSKKNESKNINKKDTNDQNQNIAVQKVRLQNPINDDLEVMRDSLIPGLLKNLALNINFSMQSLNIFEVGNVFTGYEKNNQQIRVSSLKYGFINDGNAYALKKSFDIFDLKREMVSILDDVFGVREASLRFEPVDSSSFHPNIGFKVLLGKLVIAVIGKVHPILLSDVFDIKKKDVFVYEILVNNLPPLKNLNSRVKDYSGITFQPIFRDLSCIFDQNVSITQAIKLIKRVGEVSNVIVKEVFDDEKKLGLGKISILFEITIQPKLKTLTKEEIDGSIIASIILSLESIGGVIRSVNS